MGIDTERVAQITSIAAGFAWTWAVDDLSRFCSATGWQVAEQRARAARLRTDLHSDRPTGSASFGAYPSGDRSDEGLVLEYLSAVVADVRDIHSERAIATFDELQAAISTEIGPPSYLNRGAVSTANWRLPLVMITLQADSQSISLDFVNPRYLVAEGAGSGSSCEVTGTVGLTDWADFAPTLARTLWQLPVPSHLVLGTTGNRFAQFWVAQHELSTEIASNDFLEPESRMTPGDEERMTELGWQPYSDQGCPNWYYDIAHPSHTSEFELAANRSIIALRDVLLVPKPEALHIRAWSDGSRLSPDISALTRD